MNNSKYDPERIHQRKLIINSSIAILVLILVLWGWIHVTHLHRTSTSQQQAMMASNEPVVVMFYSKTCPDCHKVAFTANKSSKQGELDAMLKNVAGDSSKQHKVMFVEYQNKDDQKLFDKYNVTQTPTFMILRNGQPQVIKNENGVPSYQYAGNNKTQVKAIYRNLQAIPFVK